MIANYGSDRALFCREVRLTTFCGGSHHVAVYRTAGRADLVERSTPGETVDSHHWIRPFLSQK